jgi:dihydrofolate reductase
MAKVLIGTIMSLDGYLNDRSGSVSRLYPDMAALDNTDLLQESIRTTGAVIMGRRTYEMGQGNYTGYEYQVPIFVLTHAAPAQAAKGQNENLSFTFVTDGIESAVAQAKAAAGERTVTVVGGASTAQQLLNAGLVDEIEVGIAPVLLGGGLRFFGDLVAESIALECTQVVQALGVTNLRFRVVKEQ